MNASSVKGGEGHVGGGGALGEDLIFKARCLVEGDHGHNNTSDLTWCAHAARRVSLGGRAFSRGPPTGAIYSVKTVDETLVFKRRNALSAPLPFSPAPPYFTLRRCETPQGLK